MVAMVLGVPVQSSSTSTNDTHCTNYANGGCSIIYVEAVITGSDPDSSSGSCRIEGFVNFMGVCCVGPLT